MSWQPLDDFLDFSPVSLNDASTNVCKQRKDNVHLEILLGKIPENLWQSLTPDDSNFQRPIRNYDTDSNDDDNNDISSMLNQLALPNEIPEDFNQRSTYKTIEIQEAYIEDRKLPLLMDSKYFKLTEKSRRNESESESVGTGTESNFESKFPTVFSEQIEETIPSTSTNSSSQICDRANDADYKDHLIANSNYYRNLKSTSSQASKKRVTIDLTKKSNCTLRFRLD